MDLCERKCKSSFDKDVNETKEQFSLCDYQREGKNQCANGVDKLDKPIRNLNADIQTKYFNCTIKEEMEGSGEYEEYKFHVKGETVNYIEQETPPRGLVDTDSSEHRLESPLDQDVKEICDFKVEGTDEYESKIVFEEKPIIHQNETDSAIMEDRKINEEDIDCKLIVKDESLDEIAHGDNVQYLIFKQEEDDLDKTELVDINEPDDVDICSECTVIVAVNDNPVPKGTGDRAAQTIPKGTLALCSSDTHGLGVFTLRHLKEGVQLGPYEGHVAKVESTSGYSWKLSGGKLVHMSDESSSNYLRYINYAKNISEQNLVGFQHNGELYYRICRDIEKGEELLIYFEDNPDETHYRPEEENPNEAFYTCQFCQLGFQYEAHRDRHQMFCKIRTDAIQFGPLCEHFTAVNASKSEDEGSQTEPVESSTYGCRGYATTKKTDLNMDMKVSQEQCTKSGYETYCKSIMRTHKQKHQQKNVVTNILECKECSYKTYSKRNFTEHKRKHDPKKMLKCQHCSYETCHKGNLKKHLLKHDKRNWLKCTDCNYESYSKYHMDSHKLKHDRRNALKCTDCNYETYSKYKLSVHILKHDQKNVLKCLDCEYETYSKYNLRMHKLRHDEKKALKCADCDFVTYTEAYLRNHRVIHDQKNAFQCPDCDYATSFKNNFKCHKLKHDEKNEIECTDCDYKTYSKYDFKKHKLRHDQKNAFKCADCDYETYCKYMMNKQELSDDKTENFKCVDCGYETYYI